MEEKTPGTEKTKLTMENKVLLYVTEQELALSLQGFMRQPLPALARLDLTRVIKTILETAHILAETKIELFKKYGAEEKDGMYSLKKTSKNWDEFEKEYILLENRTFELPLTEKVAITAKLFYIGSHIDLMMDGVAAYVLEGVIDIQR